MRMRKSGLNVAPAVLVPSLPWTPRRLFEQVVQIIDLAKLAALLGFKDVPAPAEYAQLRPGTRLLLIGLSCWIVLVAAVTLVAVTSVEMSTISFPTWFSARTSAAQVPQARVRAGYENIVQRPLFSRSRQAAMVATVEAPVAPAPVQLDQNFSLKGVFINGANAKAFLTTSQQPLGTWVKSNEELGGWKVVSIKPDQVILDNQNKRLVIPLSVNGGTK
jgi:hypothetical protein